VASSSTAIVADTTSYLPAELIEKHAINLVSLYVGIAGEQERESDVSDYDQFFERLRASDEPVTTSQPSIGDFLAVYEPLLEQGREIVSVHISAEISGTFEAANQARQRLIDDGKGGERLHVVDSVTTAGGLGLIVLAGAAAAEAGGDGAQVVARMEESRSKLKIWFSVDTLEYLRRGGRIGAARALIGTTLKIKPILTLEEEIKPIEQVRTRSRAIARLIDYARQRHGDGADGWVVQHIRDPDGAAEMVDACRSIFGREPVFVSEIGPVLGAHVGPGLIGVGGTVESVLE
jgi:fatty acid kinase fatty acid binding subunit